MPGSTRDARESGVGGAERLRRRVVLIASLTPAWAETIRTLQSNGERAEFDLIPLEITAEELARRLGRGESEPVVAIVDLTRDSIRGMSTVTAVRQLAPAIPVVVVAANPSQELARRIRLSGVFYLALDPMDADEMRTVLESAFSAIARQRSQTSACRDRQRVLLVDDDPDFLASITALLESQGYAVSNATSGRDGLDRLAQDAADLVVLDIMMKNDWAGYAVNQQVKFGNGFESVRHVPILMVSSIPVDPATRFSRAGEVDLVTPDAYLTKPVDIPRFLGLVRKLLGQPAPEPVA